jgi:cysteine-rich repeat protein
MRFLSLPTIAVSGTVLFLVGCSCGDGSTPPMSDGGPRIDAPPPPDGFVAMRCGNSMIEGSETCDDGNRDPGDGCSASCSLECGDGTVTGSELCDTAIASTATGGCPTSCDDADACTTDSLTGSDCAAECVHGTISLPVDGDGCCPSGADATTDDDCGVVCGDGTVEGTETCDTAITAGDPGACPTGCDDSIACTEDMLIGSACSAECTNVEITAPADGDGCCPAGATSDTDDDCGGCGDGTVTPPETCDTDIAAGGAGACPTACNDGMVCTTDTLIASGTCMAACTTTPIAAGTDDECCPTGATIATDVDCAARCGDMVITAPETCDDGGTTGGDGCSGTCQTEVTTTAFRLSDMDLMDPHVFAEAPFLGCTDLTNFMLLGRNGINPALQVNIQTDEDGDGDLDLSIVQTFSPLVQTAGASTTSHIVFPTCTPPLASAECTLEADDTRRMAPAMNMAAGEICLAPIAGTTRPYSPAIVSPTAPAGGTCYIADAGVLTFNLGGIPIVLDHAEVAGVWSGTPATQILNGLIRGFMSTASADTTIIPEGTTDIDSVDGEPLSSLLRGGGGNCDQPAPMMGDRDTRDGVDGWYFYFSFRAAAVTYTEL